MDACPEHGFHGTVSNGCILHATDLCAISGTDNPKLSRGYILQIYSTLERSTRIAGVTKATSGPEEARSSQLEVASPLRRQGAASQEARSSNVSNGASTLTTDDLLRIRAEEHLRKFARTLAPSVGPKIPIYQLLRGTSAPVRQAQGGLSPAFVKENIDVLRTMIKELDNRCQEKVTPRKVFNEVSGGAGSKNSQMGLSAEEVGGYSSDGSSRSRSRYRPRSARKHRKSVSKRKGTSKSHQSVRLEARSRSKSKSVKSKPQSVMASRRKSSSDSGYDTVSDSGLEDLSMPYRRPKPMPFTSRVTRLRYYRWAQLPPNARVYKGNKDPKDHINGFEELSNKFLEEFSQQKSYDKDPTEIHGIKRKPNEGLQAFMDRFKAESVSKGELGPSSGERRLQTQPKPSDLLGGKRVLVRPVEGFTPLTKTPKEILAMDNVNFPPPPPMVGTPENRNMNKLCDYHQDRGHNTNDCYHLKKQIEEAVASGRLAHLVKDIRQGG
ncbi:hypothetical protein Tco_0364384 [Tanacetum coccineum]